MLNKTFSMGEMIKTGWAKFKEHPYTWIGALLLIILIMISHPFVNSLLMGNGFDIFSDNQVPEDNFQLQSIIFLVGLVYGLIHLGLGLGCVYMGIRAVDGLSVNIGHLFGRFYYVFHYLIAEILYTIIVVVGFVLLIIPGFVWATKFILFTYFIVDQKVGPIKALKMSAEATKGAKWDIFGFLFISFCLFILGSILFLIGLLFVIPILNIAWAAVYRKLVASTQSYDVTPPLLTK
ncbi:MAG: hypothetical protein H0W88_12330 [Parachlamydiaceae bacterium]|nr:hypothetical protein [Parachlamydiaceae bacterium]